MTTKFRRSLPRMTKVTRNTSGTPVKATSARRQFMINMVATMPRSMNTSLNRLTSTSENSSLRASTSLVALVMSRPEE